jgi:hypothetical protein
VQVRAADQVALVRVESAEPTGEFRNHLLTSADVAFPDGTSRRISLPQTAPGRYEGRFPAATPGVYFFSVLQRSEQGEEIGRQVAGYALPQLAEYRQSDPNRVLSADVAKQLTTIMEGVVDRGTAKTAQVEGFTIAGKTGTAAKVIPGHGYSTTDYNVSFVGFVPSRNPQFTILVVIDSPHKVSPYGGTVAACGLAAGMDLPTSVAPFILRAVTLAGVDSVMAPKAARVEAWARLARDLDKGKLAAMTVTRPAADVTALAPEILAGKVRGRVVLELT